ncbi:hypothetical protein OAE41_00525 [bacterium]|nr:hypothetical protein [bacterium]
MHLSSIRSLECIESFRSHDEKAHQHTISGFNQILAGELDSLPEQSFYLVGNIDEVKAKAEKIAAEAN